MAKRERHGSYLLAGFEPAFWTAVKARARKDGHSVRWVILTLLDRYIKYGLSKESY